MYMCLVMLKSGAGDGAPAPPAPPPGGRRTRARARTPGRRPRPASSARARPPPCHPPAAGTDGVTLSACCHGMPCQGEDSSHSSVGQAQGGPGASHLIRDSGKIQGALQARLGKRRWRMRVAPHGHCNLSLCQCCFQGQKTKNNRGKWQTESRHEMSLKLTLPAPDHCAAPPRVPLPSGPSQLGPSKDSSPPN